MNTGGTNNEIITSAGQSERVTNFAELLAALAVGWMEGSPDNRLLIAGDNGQFVRVQPRRYLHCYYKPWPGDILIEAAPYSLRGFIRFEARNDFRDLFTTSHSGDDVWYSATLTKRGHELAVAGLLDARGMPGPFFNPPTRGVEQLPQVYRP